MKHFFSRLPGVLRYLLLMAAVCGPGIFHAPEAQAQITIAQISKVIRAETMTIHMMIRRGVTKDIVHCLQSLSVGLATGILRGVNTERDRRCWPTRTISGKSGCSANDCESVAIVPKRRP